MFLSKIIAILCGGRGLWGCGCYGALYDCSFYDIYVKNICLPQWIENPKYSLVLALLEVRLVKTLCCYLSASA